MITYTYHPTGVCSQLMEIGVEDNLIKEFRVLGGCSGNLQAISRLVNGMDIDQVIATLKGIKCQSDTSCGDQLANALIEYKIKNNIK